MSNLTWEDLSEIRSNIRKNKQIDDEKIISLVDSVSVLWNKLLHEKGKVEEMQKALEWIIQYEQPKGYEDWVMYQGLIRNEASKALKGAETK